MSSESRTDDGSVVLRYWGTRGSIPSPGPETVVFGGNTPCVEVRSGGRRWIFDGGTGVRSLGARLAAGGGAVEATILLTHYHWDHIQGLPFFSPLFQEGTELQVYGPRVGAYGPQAMMDQLLGPTNFPISCDHVKARLRIQAVEEPSFEVDGGQVSVFPTRHALGTCAYRLTVAGSTICYVPDNELVGGDYDRGPDWRDRLEAFVGEADLLIHDAMFTDAEYERVVGWGHSTAEQAVELAAAAGVKRLALFHHAPDRADSALIDIVSRLRQELALAGSSLKVWAARESETDVL